MSLAITDCPAFGAFLEATSAHWDLLDGGGPAARAALLDQLQRTAPADAALDRYLPTLDPDDFFLASAAATGTPKAVAALRDRFAGTVQRALASARLDGAAADDVAQRIWERVLCGTAERPASIASYSGRGALGAWLHVSVVREAHHEQKQNARFTSEPSLEAAFGAGGDAELEYMKSLYAERFRAAFRQALASLPARDRNLLRYTHVDGLSAERLAKHYGVHRVSVARWLGEARATLASETRRILTRDLGLAGGESESVLRLIQSRLDMSLSALAAEA